MTGRVLALMLLVGVAQAARRDEEVAFENEAAHIKRAGTLSLSEGKGPCTAVVLIAASGPMDRDEVAEGHPVFMVLSDYLRGRGIAALRYDKRGVGKSSGLESRPEVDRHRLGAIGEEMHGASPERQAAIGILCHKIFKTVAQTQDDAEAGKRIHELVLKTKGDEQLEELLTPAFVRQELTDDPVKYVRKLHVPMLALIGTLDHIVPTEPYVAVMNPTLAKLPGSKLVVLDNLNHVMQTAKTGSPMEFATLPETIAPIALQTIGDWVKVTARPIP